MNKKKYVTNAYILNVSEVYKDFKLKNKYLCNNNEKIKGNIVKNNIKNGGLLCDFKPRTHINNKINSRFFTNFSNPPCDYSKDVETEFYLRHGENSNCYSKYWKNRN